MPHIRCSHNLTLCNLILQFQFLALLLSSWISRVSTTRTYVQNTTGFSLAMDATKAQTTSSKGTTESCRLTRWDRLGCSEWLIDLPMRLLRREKPGYSLTEYWWGIRQQQVMQAQLPWLQQSSIRTVVTFMRPLYRLDALRCKMRFHGLKIDSHCTECLQCSRDSIHLSYTPRNFWVGR